LFIIEVNGPVGQIEGEEDGPGDVEGADVDVVAQLGRGLQTG